MSQIQCPYCSSTEGRCTSLGGGRFLRECRSCGRVVEERQCQVEELFVERAVDQPFCVVTPDFSGNPLYSTPPLEDDPFENIGFITAFSTWSMELSPLFTTTSTTMSGHLAELERVLGDCYFSGGGGAGSAGGGGGGSGSGGAGPSLTCSVSMVDMLRAYFQIVEVSSVLGLERDSSDHAIQLFRDCSCTTYLRNRNIEALATAALVQASREAQEPRTLQEISAAANIPQKEIARHMKLLSDALKLSQPLNSNSISVHMPRFCSLLQLNKTTQDLATHIGEVVISKSFCTRRNPISISAAAIYLSCQLEDKKKTQTEICKATGLTEVTLRKVYKELLENLDDLLPADYTPAVPPEKAFPVNAAALGRVCARTSVSAGIPSTTCHVDSSLNTSTFDPAINASMVPSFSMSDVENGSNMISSGSSAANLVWLPGSHSPFPMPMRSSRVPSSDSRSSPPSLSAAAVSSSHPTTSQNVRPRMAETNEKAKLLDALKNIEKSGDKVKPEFNFNLGTGNFHPISRTTTLPMFRPGSFSFSGVETHTLSGIWPSISNLTMGSQQRPIEALHPIPAVQHEGEVDTITSSNPPSSSSPTTISETQMSHE